MSDGGSLTATPEPQNGNGAALRWDLATVARGGALNLFGVVTSAVLSLLLVLIVARGLGPTANGIFFVSVALFSMLTAIAQWGADTGIVRTIPRLRTLGRTSDIAHAMRAGIVPVVVAGSILGLAMAIWAEPLGRLLTNGRNDGELPDVLRALAPFVAIGPAYIVALSATRGFGNMGPSVVIDKIGRPAVQTMGALLVVAAGWSVTALAVVWASPMVPGLIAALVYAGVLLRRWQQDVSAPSAHAEGFEHTFKEFWRFTAPRGLAGVFAVSILWVDTLLLGALRSPKEAGVYAAATRFLAVGQFIGLAIAQVVAPKLSELLTMSDHGRARAVYARTTTWLILAAWPLYLTMIIMAPALMAIFGHRFLAAQDAVAVLGAAMLVATAVGSVDVVLLMAGKSSWNLANTAIAVVVNVGLNLLLIPSYGMTGAAIAWAASILVNNLLPLAQVSLLVGIHPFDRGWLTAIVVCLCSFGVVEFAVRRWIGSDPIALAISGCLGGLVFVMFLVGARRRLGLDAFRDAVRRRPRVPSESLA